MADMADLIEPLIPALRRYARSLMRDPAAADDLVQDTLERSVSRWHQRRPDGDARTWMFTILHNLAVNRMRQTTRRGRHLPIEDAEESAMARPSTQEDGLRQIDIMAAVHSLPDDQRSVLLLISVEDLTYAEAARVLDVPIGTVMSRLARARARLTRIMEEESAPAAQRPHLRSVQ
ncbi:sigma-70 family RNA polymerase sigma factor [Acidisoma cladoniae]|jgi:RNA polymerase sigma factor (sigma-70 family)|uniref:sigma-70 family RNA polymerase sigma factor n=1 Tax=Acidisoma cladoniae TaxID=3040935 RepID=UPI00254BFCB2|nr:sigma-70 family RNA polymerase sigma factor [Acidisoma sp. PAMC 29798]